MKIETGVPIPARGNDHEVIALMKKMKIGDSILLPRYPQGPIYIYASAAGIKITLRKASDSESRIWRIK